MNINLMRGSQKNTIFIKIKQLNILQFDMSKEFKNNMYKIGYNAVIEHFEKKN